MQHPFLVHQAHGRIGECQEPVVFLAQAVAVARKRTHEQLQLVVCTLADVDAHASESVLQMVGAFLQVRSGRHAHHQVEMRVHQLPTLPGNHLLYTLDVIHSHLVAGIRYARVAVLLLVEQRQFPLLIGQEHNLVVHHCLGIRDIVHYRYEIHRHLCIVHFNVGVGAYQ